MAGQRRMCDEIMAERRQKEQLQSSPVSSSFPPDPLLSPWNNVQSELEPTLTLSSCPWPFSTSAAQTSFGPPSQTTPAFPSYSPNYASSSTALGSEGAGASSTPRSAFKVLSSVKRSFSMGAPKKSAPTSSHMPTYTPEETAAAQIRLSDPDTSRPPPTVQQIAAGFVTGLRPRTSSRAPPPSRSSLKKSTTSSTSTSSSVSLASTSLMSTRTGSTATAATSVASSRRTRPRFSLKDAIFGRSGVPIAPITTVSRKAVRFHVDRSPTTDSTPLPS
ncbi:hypothetical protein RhiXN_05217 [Rhizoctonia solani]|uniref:Uncharacterized protein n=1 Tax=Rhizoctonia solani TaxID=456999 RepID=A0A8H8NPT4_9AGAM|nr:uncharacterized protein RhiXN_05217 [Rhizoctonia solani]QRW17215.1 hypothetical protein RhiXN_05217 [Rhizoctonia solani]